MNISQLMDAKPSNDITYHDLLNCIEWKNKRKEILDRDNHICTICKTTKTMDGIFYSGSSILYAREINGESSFSDSKIHLEVHHEFYIRNLFPWEYDDALITVCNECHEAIHQEQKIPVYFDESKTRSVIEDPCQKCGGIGFLDIFAHVQNGICFHCHGTGVQTFWSPNKKEKIFTWQYLYENRSAFNNLFSGNYPLSESQLINFSSYLELGSEIFEISELHSVYGESKLGLIYNKSISWTEYLKFIYRTEPELLYVGDGTDIYDYTVEFDKLPIDKTIELINNKEHEDYLYFKIEPATDEDIEYLQKCAAESIENFDLIIKKHTYTDNEIFQIIINNEKLNYFNENFYNIVFKKITIDIPDFTIEKFYVLFAKRTAN